MPIRSKYDFKLSGWVMNKEEWSNIVLFTRATGVVLLMAGVKTLSFLTRFFPFSLIGRNRSFHYKNRAIRKMMEVVGVTCRRAGKEFIVEAGERDGYFYNIKGYFSKTKKRIKDIVFIKAIEKQLNLPEDSVFIRGWKGKRLRFLIPLTDK